MFGDSRGGKITMQYPEGEDWEMDTTPTVEFSPAIASVGVAANAWDSNTRMLTVTTNGGAIESAHQVTMTVAGVRTPSDTQDASIGRRKRDTADRRARWARDAKAYWSRHLVKPRDKDMLAIRRAATC